MFRKGDYIVNLSGKTSTWLRHGWVYKQYKDWETLYAEKDSVGEITHGGGVVFSNNNTWRYATEYERALYDKIGPYPLINIGSIVNVHIGTNLITKVSEISFDKKELKVEGSTIFYDFKQLKEILSDIPILENYSVY
jgi:hypothetical protein